MKEWFFRALVTMFASLFVANVQGEDLVELEYEVPPRFLTSSANEDGLIQSGVKRKRSARKVLLEAGVPFGKGASAKYVEEAGVLTVVNTPEAHQLVHHYIAEWAKEGETQFKFTVEEWTIPADADEFDWLGVPGPPSERAKKTGQGSGIELIGVFTIPQYRIMRKLLSEREDVPESALISVVARPGQEARVEKPDRWLCFLALHSSNRQTHAVSLSAQKRPLGWIQKPSPLEVTVWDGMTIAFSAEEGLFSFLTVRLLDPASIPIHTDEEIVEFITEASTEEGSVGD